MGSPLPGLGEAELGRFRAGEALFNRIFAPEDGLGPLFNDNQCSACHTSPVTGGTGDQFLTRVSRWTDGRCNELRELGGDNIRIQATPQLKALGIERQPVPDGATERVRFNVPFLFGLGLIEAIPEEQIVARADPGDRDRDGISGRAGADGSGRFARFGRKAEQGSLRAFIENAAHGEMGLTTPLHPEESTRGLQPLPEGIDPSPEPELTEAQVELITDFVRFLSPGPQRFGETEQDRASIMRGEEHFRASGCTGCHTPSMTTGDHEIEALSRKRIFLYSDLLLHDMGPDLSNICTAGAAPAELRTEPLMGLGQRASFLHDSRAGDLTEAILLHGGEATAARERFRALHELQQHQLIRFLKSL